MVNKIAIFIYVLMLLINQTGLNLTKIAIFNYLKLPKIRVLFYKYDKGRWKSINKKLEKIKTKDLYGNEIEKMVEVPDDPQPYIISESFANDLFLDTLLILFIIICIGMIFGLLIMSIKCFK